MYTWLLMILHNYNLIIIILIIIIIKVSGNKIIQLSVLAAALATKLLCAASIYPIQRVMMMKT